MASHARSGAYNLMAMIILAKPVPKARAESSLGQEAEPLHDGLQKPLSISPLEELSQNYTTSHHDISIVLAHQPTRPSTSSQEARQILLDGGTSILGFDTLHTLKLFTGAGLLWGFIVPSQSSHLSRHRAQYSNRLEYHPTRRSKLHKRNYVVSV